VITWTGLTRNPAQALAFWATVSLSLVTWPGLAGDVAAQESRAAVIEQAQAEKGTELVPPTENVAERILGRLDDWGLFIGQPRKFYPWLGSVYPGGGFAGGAGFRETFGDDGAVNVYGGYSVRGFSRAQADLQLPTIAARRVRLTLSGRYVDATDVRFYGVGNLARKDDLTRFGYTPLSGGARLDVGDRRFTVGGGVDYLAIDVSRGQTDPSIEDRFVTEDIPGLGRSKFDYVNSLAYMSFDWRRQPGYSGSGGFYRVQFDDFRERELDTYSFQSVEAEAQQLIPILRANWVIALRGLATITDIGDTAVVPFFMLPSLGGGSTLRGYPDFRFRDRNRMLMTAELRWTPARFLDMALFYDTGKVTSRRQDLDFTNLKESYGIGMRVVGAEDYVVRLELAHSREHAVRFLFGVGRVF
jgi:hypothetical protein